MARLEIRGLGAIQVSFERMADGLDARVRGAMDRAAQALAERIRETGAKKFRGKKPATPLESLVKPGQPLVTADLYLMEVWPQGSYTGTRGSARRAATVGFVLEYGRSNMQGRAWFAQGTRRATAEVNSILDGMLGGGMQ